MNKANHSIPELTCRVILLAIILTILLALSNAYLALKLGILTSASIPAAIISMGVLRFFKKPTILENNAVQTAASAGEAVAGGIVYTIPALIIIQFWHGFDYLTNFFIAATGGILGVLFSIPLRRILVNEPMLMFPEGRAIAELLHSSAHQSGIKDIFLGSLVGGGLELLQNGFKLIASSWSYWILVKRSLLGLGLGFSPTMVGAGYLVGPHMAISILLGALISWIMAVPIVSQFYPQYIHHHPAHEAITLLWNNEMRYLGIGAMLFAGTWTFLKLVKPLIKSITLSHRERATHPHSTTKLPRTDRDIPIVFIGLGVFATAMVLFFFFQHIFPLNDLNLPHHLNLSLLLGAVFYVLIIGFLFSVITAYFSGMVGVTASPGSSVVIAGMLFAAWILLTVINFIFHQPLTHDQLLAAEAITIIIGSVVTGIAAIANDNTQDLKVGQLVGATPWRQQIMLLLGVIVSSLVIPPVMQLLFSVYGIAGIMPHEGMDPTQSLPAPTAALMAAITEAVFRNQLPANMMIMGASLMLILTVLTRLLKIHKWFKLSLLGVAIGMYLPLTSTVPLFLGGLIAMFVNKKLNKQTISAEKKSLCSQRGVLIACGLVAGSAIMDIVLAIPFSLLHNPNALSLVGANWLPYGVLLAIISTLLLAFWIVKRTSIHLC